MEILGLDIGKTTGWAHFKDNELIAHGVVLCDRKKPLFTLEKFRALLSVVQPCRIFVEDVGFSRFTMAHASYWQIRTFIEIAADERSRYPIGAVGVTELKKWATGSGKAKKHDMCAEARKRYGVDLFAWSDDEKRGKRGDEDQADAILVGAWAACKLNQNL